MIMVRVSRRPAFFIRYSRRANSFDVSSIVFPARSTFLSTRSSLRSATVKCACSGARPRRNNARTRAESSEYEKGLTRQSSAPASRVSTRSTTRLRPVNTRTGRSAHALQNRETVEPRQIEIEHQQVIIELDSHGPGLLAIIRGIDRVVLLLKPLLDEAG